MKNYIQKGFSCPVQVNTIIFGAFDVKALSQCTFMSCFQIRGLRERAKCLRVKDFTFLFAILTPAQNDESTQSFQILFQNLEIDAQT